MKPHRLAEYFPLLEGEEFEQLKQDIKEYGQLEPIVIFDGQILDGVNRWNAIQDLINEGESIEPDLRYFDGEDALRYVISANIRRRHLNTSQRAMLATEMLPEFEIEAKKRQGMRTDLTSPSEEDNVEFGAAASFVAKEFSVSTPTIERAKRVKEQAPEKVKDIVEGKTSVRKVDTELRQQRAAEKAAAKKDKQETKQRQEDDKEVAEYYNNLKLFKEHLKLHKQQVEKAIRVAEYGKFAPEAKNFTNNKHLQIIDLMMEIQNLYDELEGSIDG